MDLYPYQHAGVKHLLSQPFGRPHALLADSPGTGKTIMMIEAAKQSNCKTGLIICPAIIKEQWRRQMIAWGLADDDEIQVLYGTNAVVNCHPWVIVNYDIARDPAIKKQLAARKWNCLTLDEAHRLKTHSSQQTHAVFHKQFGIAVNAYYKWAMSGSIMPNRPLELYPLLATLAPEVIKPYDNWPAYIQRYCGGAFQAGKGASNIAELTERLQPFMLRRELKDVWKECPELHENIVWLDVPFENHPEWIGSNFMEPATERRIVAETKAPQSVAYIRDRFESGVDKIVVFSYHRNVLNQFFQSLGKYHPVKIYGGVSSKERADNLLKFQTDPSCRLFLVQIVSGGEGLDGLQHVCNEVIEAEPEWSPGREDQAIHRVLRLGQTRPVILTKLLASRSYEEIIFYSNRAKRKVIDIVCAANGEQIDMAKKTESIEENIAAIRDVLERMLAGNGLVPAGGVPAQAPAALAPTAPPIAAPPTLPPSGATAPSTPPPPAPPPASLPPAEAQESFEDQVIRIQKPKGKAGFERVQQLNAHYGAKGLSEVPVEKQAEYLQYL